MARGKHDNNVEEEPLLATEPITGSDEELAIEMRKGLLGPLEISAATRHRILISLWLSMFLGSLNTTLVATLVSSISSEFHRSNQASWLGTSYLLATCTFTPLYGRLSNVLGRRGAYQLALGLCGVGILLCGLAPSLELLILARFLAGMGGGGIFTTNSIIISDMYSLRERSLTQGIQSIFNGLGMGLGGPIGGFVSDRFGWRWAFLIQVPLYVLAFLLTSLNLKYATPGKGKSAKEILGRIDYGGSFTLLTSVGSLLFFLSYKYNDEYPWDHPVVISLLAACVISFLSFIIIELRYAVEPVLAPFLLRRKVPVLVGASNFLVSQCSFAVMYFFPMWFETVQLTSSSVAGLHLLPNSISMSLGSLFAGYVMHRTGKYKMLNLVFGILPAVAAVLLARLTEDSNEFEQWFHIVPLGFGNAVVLQTTLIALLASVDQTHVAVATGFTQLFRGIGQVSGVAIASAVFQSILDRELTLRITGPGSEDLIRRIRHSSRLVAQLPPDIQRAAVDSYAISLRAVFIYAAACTFGAFLVRIPIPEHTLEENSRGTPTPTGPSTPREESLERQNEVPPLAKPTAPIARPKPITPKPKVRRLSGFESLEDFPRAVDDIEEHHVPVRK